MPSSSPTRFRKSWRRRWPCTSVSGSNASLLIRTRLRKHSTSACGCARETRDEEPSLTFFQVLQTSVEEFFDAVKFGAPDLLQFIETTFEIERSFTSPNRASI